MGQLIKRDAEDGHLYLEKSHVNVAVPNMNVLYLYDVLLVSMSDFYTVCNPMCMHNPKLYAVYI